MTNQNNAAQAATLDPISEAIVILTEEADTLSDCHTRTIGDWAGEDEVKARYDYIQTVIAALSKLRAPVSSIREGFELTYDADADDPVCATELSHFTNGWRACIMSQVGKPVVMKLAIDATAAIDLINATRRGLRAPVADERAAFEKIVTQIDAKANFLWNPDFDCYRDKGVQGAWRLYIYGKASTALASAPVAGEPAFYINSSLIDPRTGRIKAEIRDPLTWSDTPVGNWLTPVFIAPVAGEAQPERGDPACPRDDSDRTYDRPIGYLPSYELGRLHSGHDANLRSAKFGPSTLDGDVPVYLDPPKPDASPQASAEARWIGIDLGENGIADVRNAALEQAYEAVACLYAAHYQHGDLSALAALKEAGDDIRALKQPQAAKGQQ